jgi:hypothetical protein
VGGVENTDQFTDQVEPMIVGFGVAVFVFPCVAISGNKWSAAEGLPNARLPMRID